MVSLAPDVLAASVFVPTLISPKPVHLPSSRILHLQFFVLILQVSSATMTNSSLSCSISGSGGYSPDLPQQSAPSSVSNWSTSAEDVPTEQPQVVGQSLVENRPAAGWTFARRRPAVAGPSRAGESPEGIASVMMAQEIINLRARYQIPTNLRLYRPLPEDRITSSYPGRVALYEYYFKAGLRIPLHPFILNVLDRYSLALAQLVPNSIRTLVGFLVLCHIHGIEARISLFRCFYTLRKQSGWWSFTPRPTRILKLYLPTSVKGWKSRFFFAQIEGVKTEWGIPDTEANKDPRILPRDQEAFGQLITADVPRCNRLLAEENLRLAGIIPSDGEQYNLSSFGFSFSSFLTKVYWFAGMAPSLREIRRAATKKRKAREGEALARGEAAAKVAKEAEAGEASARNEAEAGEASARNEAEEGRTRSPPSVPSPIDLTDTPSEWRVEVSSHRQRPRGRSQLTRLRDPIWRPPHPSRE